MSDLIDREVITAIHDFSLEYEKAVKYPQIRKPIAYALYQTWKKWDRKEKRNE